MRVSAKLILLLIVFCFCFHHLEARKLDFEYLTVKEGLSQNSVFSIVKDKYGFMWFGTWEGASRFDGYSFKIFRAEADNPSALSNNRINAIVMDDHQNIWIQTGDHRYVFRFNYDVENFTRFALLKAPVIVQKKLLNYNLKNNRVSNRRYTWTATDNGLLETDHQSGLSTMYTTNRNSLSSINDHVINTVFLDDSDNLWVGTQNGGVNHANLREKQFEYYAVGAIGFHDNVVRAFCQDKAGKLWVGTDADGVTVIDRNSLTTSSIHYGKSELIDSNIRAIFCDHTGDVWIGTKGGLDCFDTRTGRFHHYFAGESGSISHPWVFKIMEDKRHNLWVGTFDGIARYDRINRRFVSYNSPKILNSQNVRDIMEDSRGNLWVATEGGGITCLQRKPIAGGGEQLIPRHYRHKEGDTNSLINDLTLSTIEDEEHKIWIATNSGLCRLDPSTEIFNRFSIASGFPDDLIMGLLTDGKGSLWISHKKGLTRMNIRTFAFRTFDRYDGLQGNEFSQNTCYRNPGTGEMFFGGTNGLNSFFPNKIALNPLSHKPVLTGLKILNKRIEPGIKVNNRLILHKSLMNTERISLTWEEMTFSISFSSLNFNNPNGCRYKYKLEGIDRDWIYTDATMREATYTHLPSGNYEFKVCSSNSDGVWAKESASVFIEILPPWWLSWWAKMFYFLSVCIAGWFVYRYIVSRIEFRNKLMLEQLKNEKNEELMNIKLQFFTEISHEFRTPLTLIIDPLEQLLAGCTDEQQVQYYYQLMNRNAKQLLELINQLLDFRKLQSRNLILRPVSADLVAFIRNLSLSFDLKAREQNITFVVTSSQDEIMADFDEDKMRKIMNNLISNAFNYTPAYGKICVHVALANNEVVVEVQDSGVGIAPEYQSRIFDAFYQVAGEDLNSKGTGLGLALTKELVLLHRGKITIESEKNNGACFRFSIPLHQSLDSNQAEQSFQSHSFVSPMPEVTVLQESTSEDKDLPILLVVDDNADIREYISMNFKDQYQVFTANNGLEGFNKAIEVIPDLIISDIMMPGVDGIELCQRLKSDEFTSHIPVILLTARQSDDSRIEGYGTGADAYITKPFNKKVLEARMKNLLDQRAKLQQLIANGIPESKRVTVNVTDDVFLKKVVALVEERMEEADFEADILADCLKMSRSQLYRKIKALTNRTVHEFITSIRMNKARVYLLSGEFTIAETAYKVGYTLPTNFTRTFTKQFGVTPSNYLKNHKK